MGDARGRLSGIYRFDRFTLDLHRGMLLGADDEEIPLRPKSFALLRTLVENAGKLLDHDALMAAVWPGVFVTDESIAQCVKDVRRALGEQGQRLIRTVVKRGYVLNAEVTNREGEENHIQAVEATAVSLATPSPEGARPLMPSMDMHPDGAPRQQRWRQALPRQDDPLSAEAASTSPDLPSLAVLPFANLSNDPEQDYFADGLAEELTTALSRARWFSVAARSSAFAYKGRVVDTRQVGRELRVRYVLEGSVRRDAGKVRIACSLAETETGRQVWAGRLESDLAGIFELQDRVAEAVTFAIEPSLQRAEIERARVKPTENLDAYDLYLRARLQFYAVTQEGCDAALALLRQAIALDPDFAVAKAFAATCLSRRYVQGWAGPGDREEGIRLAREALAANTVDPMALICIADGLGVLAQDANEAHAAAAFALALNANSIQVRNMIGWTSLWVGDPEAALGHFRHAIRLGLHDPSAAYPLTGVAMAHLMAGRPQEALDHAEAALRKVPALVPGHQAAIAALVALDRRAEAAAAAGRFRQATPAARHRVPARFYHNLYLDKAFVEAFLHALREVGLPE